MSHQHILAAIDMSADSAEVMNAASGIAAQAGARLSVITVIKPIYATYGTQGESLAGPTTFELDLIGQAREQLSANATALGIASDDVHVVVGNPATEVRTKAIEVGADLIVIGSHGRHGLGLLLGSTANGVLHGAPCDMLVIRLTS